MKIQPIGYVSVIGVSFIEPILRLLEDLSNMEPGEPNEVQTNPRENGYSCGIIVISVLLLESAINRTRYIREGSIDRRKSSSEYFKSLFTDKDLINQVEEIFTIRDAITHNHLWTADINWDDNAHLVFASAPQLLDGFGNERFRKVLNGNTKLSKQLSLNLLPTKIWRKDAHRVIKAVHRALDALEGRDRNYFYLSPQHFEYRGKLMPFAEIVSSLA